MVSVVTAQSERRDHPTLGIATYIGNLLLMSLLGAMVKIGALVPNAIHLPMFLVFGIMCAGQQWLLTISFRYAEASLLAPLSYLAIIFALETPSPIIVLTLARPEFGT